MELSKDMTCRELSKDMAYMELSKDMAYMELSKDMSRRELSKDITYRELSKDMSRREFGKISHKTDHSGTVIRGTHDVTSMDLTLDTSPLRLVSDFTRKRPRRHSGSAHHQTTPLDVDSYTSLDSPLPTPSPDGLDLSPFDVIKRTGIAWGALECSRKNRTGTSLAVTPLSPSSMSSSPRSPPPSPGTARGAPPTPSHHDECDDTVTHPSKIRQKLSTPLSHGADLLLSSSSSSSQPAFVSRNEEPDQDLTQKLSHHQKHKLSKPGVNLGRIDTEVSNMTRQHLDHVSSGYPNHPGRIRPAYSCDKTLRSSSVSPPDSPSPVPSPTRTPHHLPYPHELFAASKCNNSGHFLPMANLIRPSQLSPKASNFSIAAILGGSCGSGSAGSHVTTTGPGARDYRSGDRDCSPLEDSEPSTPTPSITPTPSLTSPGGDCDVDIEIDVGSDSASVTSGKDTGSIGDLKLAVDGESLDETTKIKCRLETKDLWDKFHELGTEMIITKTGR
ncbi:endoribonuclease CG2145-like [Physella acuta]|uniref:endoribonuclease CG2145-like n=1 Tax=Physella acuta TaxID=109671 RepID=UPI0027DDD915|nr:endoribonuclease CG2145-like [Physella acuta]